LRQSAALAALGAQIVVLFFSQLNRLPDYRAWHGIPPSIPLLADEGRSVYNAYGMRVGTLRQIYAPEVLAKYARLIKSGMKLRLKTDEDTRQLGGDIVVGPDGKVLFALCSKNQADRPSVETIIEAIPAGQP
jgi:hypothetical protein